MEQKITHPGPVRRAAVQRFLETRERETPKSNRQWTGTREERKVNRADCDEAGGKVASRHAAMSSSSFFYRANFRRKLRYSRVLVGRITPVAARLSKEAFPVVVWGDRIRFEETFRSLQSCSGNKSPVFGDSGQYSGNPREELVKVLRKRLIQLISGNVGSLGNTPFFR